MKQRGSCGSYKQAQPVIVVVVIIVIVIIIIVICFLWSRSFAVFGVIMPPFQLRSRNEDGQPTLRV